MRRQYDAAFKQAAVAHCQRHGGDVTRTAQELGLNPWTLRDWMQADRRKNQPPAPARALAENLADLSTACAVGCKRNSHGHQESWIGYKLHLEVVDRDLPVSAVLTAAGVHDRQVAISLARMTAQRIT